jgi:hypothetical protein
VKLAIFIHIEYSCCAIKARVFGWVVEVRSTKALILAGNCPKSAKVRCQDTSAPQTLAPQPPPQTSVYLSTYELHETNRCLLQKSLLNLLSEEYYAPRWSVTNGHVVPWHYPVLQELRSRSSCDAIHPQATAYPYLGVESIKQRFTARHQVTSGHIRSHWGRQEGGNRFHHT